MSNTATGKLVVKNDTAQVSGKFKKRTIVLAIVDGNFTEEVEFELTQERVTLIEPFRIGDELEVNYNLRGKKWVSPKDGIAKYFNTLAVWRVTLAGTDAPESQKTEEHESLPF